MPSLLPSKGWLPCSVVTVACLIMLLPMGVQSGYPSNTSTFSHTLTVSPSAMTMSPSVSMRTPSMTSLSTTLTPLPTRTQTFTHTISGLTPTETILPTRTQTFSASATFTRSVSINTQSSSVTGSIGTFSKTVSRSINTQSSSMTGSIGTFSKTASRSISVTVSPAPTRTATFSTTLTFTRGTPSASDTRTGSTSQTRTISLTPSFPTPTFTASLGPTLTQPITGSVSLSLSRSLTATKTLPPTPSMTLSFSRSLTLSISISGSRSASVSFSKSMTLSLSLSRSATRTGGSPSATPTSEETISLPITESLPVTVSDTGDSATQTVSASDSVSVSNSPSIGTPSESYTDSEPLTTSALPPTTTPLPTPTVTIPTGCPDCQNGTCAFTEVQGSDGYVLRLPFCQCYSDFSRGFWVGGRVLGEACTECQPFVWGEGCLRICPGGLCTPCSSHGVCNDGLHGSGRCNCFNGTQNQGVWAGDDCSSCAPGYYNDTCADRCECVNGACNAGRKGNGTCVCDPEWDGPRCDRCAFGFWGPECTACRPSATNPCNGHGTCQLEDGECYCDIGWRGELCQVVCADCNCPGLGSRSSAERQCRDCVPQDCFGHGRCDNTTARCECDFGYGGFSRTAVDPYTGMPQPDCSRACPVGGGSVCSGHGTCTADGVCRCFSNATHGFYTGGSCDSCQLAYNSTGCTTPCPVDPGSGQICNNGNVSFVSCFDGRCLCNTPLTRYCGATCEILSVVVDGVDTCANNCTNGRWGPSCNRPCTCINNGVCVTQRSNLNGQCICPPAFTGLNCEIVCDGSTVDLRDPGNLDLRRPCNGHGQCIASTGRCSCDPEWGSQNCTNVCIKSNSTPPDMCYGHGACDAGSANSGLCRCNSGYVGPTTGCRFQCPCASPASGRCNDQGVCVCAAFFTGFDCASCIPGLSGENCGTRCSPLHGTTNGTTCDCSPGRGGPGCANACGIGADGTLCSGHGICGFGQDDTGLCRCDPSSNPATAYVGPSCNCTNIACQTERRNSRCDASTGQCICTKRYGGPVCDDCSRETWGADCTEVCSCGDHGYCQRLSGQCICDSDSQVGFWTGERCDDCQEGYFGADCTQRSVYSTQLPSFTISIAPAAENYFAPIQSRGLMYCRGTSSVLSPFLRSDGNTTAVQNNGTLFTAGAVITQLIDANDRIPQLTYYATTTRYLECGAAPIDMFYSRGRVFFLSGCPVAGTEFHERVVITAQVATLPVIAGPANMTEVVVSFEPGTQRALYRALFFYRNVSGAVPGLPSDTSIEQHWQQLEDYGLPTLCLFEVITRGLINRYFAVQCHANFTVSNGLQRSSPSAQFGFTVAELSVMRYVPYPRDAIIVFGLNDLAECVGFELSVSSMQLSPFRPMETIDDAGRCTSVRGAVIAGDFVVVVIQRAGMPRVLRTRISGNGAIDNQWRSPDAEPPAQGHEAVALAYDEPSRTVYMIVNRRTTAYFVKILCEPDRFEILGSQGLDTTDVEDRRASAVSISEDSRIVSILQQKAQGVAVRRYIAYDVTGVVPPFSDRRGGTTLSILGRGFASSDLSAVKGKVGAIDVPATVVSTEVVTLQTPPTQASECENDAISVSMFGDIFTINKVSISRYEPPSLSRAEPATQYYKAPAQVTISGVGFFDSDYTMCQYSTSTSSSGGTPLQHFSTSRARTPTVTLDLTKTQSLPKTVSRSVSHHTWSLSRSLPPTPTVSQAMPTLTLSKSIDIDVPPTAAPTPPPSTPPPSSSGSWVRHGDVDTLTMPGRYAAGIDSIVCPSLVGVAEAWRGTIDVALDGSVYSGMEQLIILVGEAAGFQLSYDSVTVTADSTVVLPPLTVEFVDAAGNAVGDTFSTSVSVMATLRRAVGGSNVVMTPPATAIEALAGTALVTFDSLTLSLPPATETDLVITARYVFSAQPLSWRQVCRITITQGQLDRLLIVQEPSESIDAGGRIAKKPIIDLLDVAGNRLGTGASETFSAHAHVMEQLHADDAPSELLDELGPGLATNNFTAACLSGTCSFDDSIDRIEARFGFSYTLYIWAESRETGEVLASAVSTMMLPSCSPGTFRRLGSYTCDVCVESANCLGGPRNEIVLDEGYWRSGPYNWEIYRCVPFFACRGGNMSGAPACDEGYVGPRCGDCAAGYAKSIGGNCVQCEDRGVSIGMFIFIVIFATGFLIGVVVLSAQNWKVASGAVVVLQLLLTHLQTTVSIGELEASYPSFFDDVISWVSVIVDLRVLDISFADCVLRADGANFLAKFTAFALAPVIALVAGGVAWVILFINSEFLRLEMSKQSTLSATRRQYLRRERHKRRERWRKEAESLAKYGVNADEYIEAREAPEFDEESGDASKALRRSDYRFLAVTALQVVMFFTYPTSVAYSLKMLFCETVVMGNGDSVSVLSVDMTINCDDPTYQIFRRVAIVTSIVLLIGVPFGYVAAYFVHSQLRKTRKVERKQLFSFLLQGLKPRQWVWPAVVFLRKGLFKVIVVTLPAPADAWCALWLILLYIPLLVFVQPYEDPVHTRLDAVSTAADAVAINAAFALMVTTDEVGRNAIAAVAMAVLGVVAMWYVWVSSAYLRFALRRWFTQHVLHKPVTMYIDDGQDEGKVTGRAATFSGAMKSSSPKKLDAAEAERVAKEEEEAELRGVFGTADDEQREQSAWLLDRLREHGYGEADPLGRAVREHRQESEERARRAALRAKRDQATSFAGGGTSSSSGTQGGSFDAVRARSRSFAQLDGAGDGAADPAGMPRDDDGFDDWDREYAVQGSNGEELSTTGTHSSSSGAGASSLARPFFSVGRAGAASRYEKVDNEYQREQEREAKRRQERAASERKRTQDALARFSSAGLNSSERRVRGADYSFL